MYVQEPSANANKRTRVSQFIDCGAIFKWPCMSYLKEDTLITVRTVNHAWLEAPITSHTNSASSMGWGMVLFIPATSANTPLGLVVTRELQLAPVHAWSFPCI